MRQRAFFSNFSFAYFHLQAGALSFPLCFLILSVFLHLSPKRLKTFHPWLTFLLPIFLILTQYFIWEQYDHELFAKLKREDSVYEYLTALFFLRAGWLALRLARRQWPTAS